VPVEGHHPILREFFGGRRESQRAGLAYMVVACVLFTAMGGFVNAVQLREPDVSSLVCSFVRLVVNLLILVGFAASQGAVRELPGDGRPSLWLRGLFGSASLITSFAAIKAIGIGESSFLHASNGFFVALLAPLILKQRNTLLGWIAIGGAVAGLGILLEPRANDAFSWGRPVAVLSGFFAALAYLMIAKVGKSNAPSSVIFWFCAVGTAIHLAIFAVVEVQWPVHQASWFQLVAAGTFAAVAQYFLTRSWQLAPAALNAAVSYLGPVMSLFLSVAIFGRRPDLMGWLGVCIVLVCGVVLPFARASSHRAAA
jgi:S-adenosylmethionine uptake transporter